MNVRTKIVCTIGPSVSSIENIKKLIEAGMNVARLNFSHGSYEDHKRVIEILKKVREQTNNPLAILLDTKGPEIRIKKVHGDKKELTKGSHIKLVEECKAEDEFAITPFYALKNVEKGTTILFDDGYISSKVLQVKDDCIVVVIINNGTIRSGKGVNIPSVKIDLPAMTDKDVEDIKFGCKEGIDVIAASFIRSAEQILQIKKLLFDIGYDQIPVIAKIENSQGVENFDSIVEVADGIMIARGDLGVEVELGLVPKYQKMMIKKCYIAAKPVITATQMLESMINNPRPTRAEASDVANAIYDSTSLVMLSGETAVGSYPIDAVTIMKKIIKETENDFDYKGFFEKREHRQYNDVSSSVAIAAVKTAYSANAKAIFVYTSSGFTARLVSALRPSIPIICLTSNIQTYHQLSFLWGVKPVYHEKVGTEKAAFSIMCNFAMKNNIVNFGDLIVTTAGVPFGEKGSTNMMMVSNIGSILIRGYKGNGEKVAGDVFKMIAPPKENMNVKDKILVIPRCDDSYLSYMKEAKGVILQNQIGDTVSEKYAIMVAKSFKISLIVRADNALSVLTDNESVILDPVKGLVYEQNEFA